MSRDILELELAGVFEAPIFVASKMFVGGIGFMTMATFLLIVISQRITIGYRLLVRESLGFNQISGLIRLTLSIVAVSMGIMLLGFFARQTLRW